MTIDALSFGDLPVSSMLHGVEHVFSSSPPSKVLDAVVRRAAVAVQTFKASGAGTYKFLQYQGVDGDGALPALRLQVYMKMTEWRLGAGAKNPPSQSVQVTVRKSDGAIK